MTDHIQLALVGNPNCGKTALFNALTGAEQRVGNWPGVTVARFEGGYQYRQQRFGVVDLPGIYSAYPHDATAVDEKIACEFLESARDTVLVNVIDATQLVRHLYLTLQLVELGQPMVVVLNMTDKAGAQGINIDVDALAERLGCPVVPVVATAKKGLVALRQAVLQASPAESAIDALACAQPAAARALMQNAQTELQQQGYHETRASQLVIRVFEQGGVHAVSMPVDLAAWFEAALRALEAKAGVQIDVMRADARYRLACEWGGVVTSRSHSKQSLTERIDRWVLNRFLAIPIFLLVIYSLFVFAINGGGIFQDAFDIASRALFVDGVTQWLHAWHAPELLTVLLAQGIGVGLHTVITFIPTIAAMFFFLGALEDSGYMARAAFVVDRWMHVLGLPGRAFVPMIVGFGCNVPAVMGARTLHSRQDRVLTVMMMPFMSCGARLAIFSVFANAFFKQHGALLVFSLYLIGIVVALLTGWVLRNTLLKGQAPALVMELPAYHRPRLKPLLQYVRRRLRGFIWRAGQYILPICLLISVLQAVDWHGQRLDRAANAHSILASVGQTLTPVFAPMGVASQNWPAVVGLMTGVLAKEVVIGTLNGLYTSKAAPAPLQSVSRQFLDALRTVPEKLSALSDDIMNPIAAIAASAAQQNFSPSAVSLIQSRFNGPAAAFSYVLFVLLYFPCISTLAVMRQEVGARWAAFSMWWSTGLAYVMAVAVFQLTELARHPVVAVSWLMGLLLFAAAVFWLLLKAAGSTGRVGADQNGG